MAVTNLYVRQRTHIRAVVTHTPDRVPRLHSVVWVTNTLTQKQEKHMSTRRLLPIAVIVGTIGITSALPCAAQSTTGDMNRSTVRTEDRGFDWGWLGLIGLAGLAGLRRRPDSSTDYSAPRTAR
jgi:MYXO-CTERM domain-containing protein